MTLPRKGLKTRPYSMDMEDHIVTQPKRVLKTRPYSMDMNKDIATLPKKGLKTRPYNIVMEKKGLKKYDYNVDMDMEKLTKGQLLKQGAETPAKRPPKPTRAPPLPPSNDFNFDDDIFQTKNTSLGKFKIVGIRNRENKKFKSYTNEFRVKVLKELDDDNEIYHIFQELVKTVKKRRNLSDNDLIRVVIQNEELANVISTKFNKVESFKLGDLKNIINMEYRGIPLETSKIVVQSVKIPTGKGRLCLTKDTISRKCCIITVKNDDTTCLARSIVTAVANLHPEKWTKTQLHDGFNKSRKLQKEQAMKLHEEANVEINDYGNDLSDIEKFAKHLEIEISIIDAEQFNSIVHTANKGSEDKIYLLKTRNHFDVIKSLTAFYDAPYYCHECKKAYTERD